MFCPLLRPNQPHENWFSDLKSLGYVKLLDSIDSIPDLIANDSSHFDIDLGVVVGDDEPLPPYEVIKSIIKH